MTSRGKRLAALAVAATFAAVPAAHAAGPCADRAGKPWCDPTFSPDKRAGLLLGALTQDEKITLLSGDSNNDGHTGATQAIARVGLPKSYNTDGPVGVRQGSATALPTPMAEAASFDPQMAFLHGQTIGNEARAKGNDGVLAPTVNLMRTPLNGRTFEAFGEDPFLVSRTAVAWVKAAQATGVLVNIKHFAFNNQEGRSACCANMVKPGDQTAAIRQYPDMEGGRMKVNVSVDERTMHETELMAFEAAVKEAHVASVMCSYNKLHGVFACENDELLKGILSSWGFQGFVLSDYLAAHDTGPSLKGGLDFEPWPGFDVYGPAPVN